MKETQKKPKDFLDLPFVERVLSNQTVISLIIVLLVMLIVLIFTQIGYILNPVWDLISIVGFPIIGAAVLYYLFFPVVKWSERYGIDRNLSIWFIFLIIIILLTWGALSLFPILRNQSMTFAKNFPYYIEQFGYMIEEMKVKNANDASSQYLNNIIQSIDLDSLSQKSQDMVGTWFESLGSVIGTITQVVTGVITIPVVLYYLLLQGDKLSDHLVRVVPTKHRDWLRRVLHHCNHQISQYIRGQILVAIFVGIMFAIGYAVIGLDYGISLAVLAGVLNIIPFLGSFMAAVPAFIVALFTSPMMVFKLFIVLMIEQTIEGRFVQPLILGNNLEIHPVTILFILLSSGKLFGVTGIIIAVPVYAVIKVIVKELFFIYQIKSGLYEDEEIIKVQVESSDV